MRGNVSGERPSGTWSVSKRFTLAFIGVVTLLLVGFAVVAIAVDIRTIDRELQDLLNDTARLTQVSLAVPLWNVDTATIASFARRIAAAGLARICRDPFGRPNGRPEQSTATPGPGFPLLHRVVGVPRQDRRYRPPGQEDRNGAAGRLERGRPAGDPRESRRHPGTHPPDHRRDLRNVHAHHAAVRRAPLAALQRSAGLIAGGNLDAPIDTTHQDEVGHLARDLDAMRGSLRALIQERRQNEERLEDANRTLEQKVEERTGALQSKTQELTRTVEELQALGLVGRVVSSTLDLETVLSVIVAHAVQITGTDGGAIYEYEAPTQTFHLRVAHQMEAELVDALRAHPPARRRHGGPRRATRLPVQIPDIHEEGTYDARLRDLFGRDDFRARLAVPLIREDEIIGALVVRRRAPGPSRPS